MKKILIYTALLITSSCEVCKECACTTYTGANTGNNSRTEFEVCGRDEIRQVEGKTTTTANGVSVITNCVCK